MLPESRLCSALLGSTPDTCGLAWAATGEPGIAGSRPCDGLAGVVTGAASVDSDVDSEVDSESSVSVGSASVDRVDGVVSDSVDSSSAGSGDGDADGATGGARWRRPGSAPKAPPAA